jgi:exosome complex component RRP43
LDRKHILADPTAFEEPLFETTVSVIVDQHGALLSATQLGEPSALSFGSSTEVGIDVLPICIDAAQARARELVRSIYQA